MVKRRKAVKKEKPNYAFIFFTVLIFVGAAAAYAVLSSSSSIPETKSSVSLPSQENVHRHATLKIEGIDIKTLPTAEQLRVEHPLHLHGGDAFLHMEGSPTPLINFFKSVGFDVSNYEVYVNGNKVDFNYIFSDGDEIELIKKGGFRG